MTQPGLPFASDATSLEVLGEAEAFWAVARKELSDLKRALDLYSMLNLERNLKEAGGNQSVPVGGSGRSAPSTAFRIRHETTRKEAS